MKEVRPTSGKVVQAVFNIISPVRDCNFLDLFSGTGRIALEAWKRGAENVVAVEILRERCRTIRKPEDSEGKRSFTVLCMNVRRSMAYLSRKKMAFDFIFADPPYESGWCKELPLLLDSKPDMFKDRGILIFEHSARENVEFENTYFELLDSRTYGDNSIEILRRRI